MKIRSYDHHAPTLKRRVFSGGINFKRPELSTPEYKTWRAAVFKRDKRTCKMCGAKRVSIQAHHIKRWADHPYLRYDVNNGITLCNKCHRLVFGKEKDYESYFHAMIVPSNKDLDTLRLMYKAREKELDE